MKDQLSLFDTDKFKNKAPYKSATKFLDDKLKFGIKPGTERIEALLKELDDPHTKYETILVTGTNGKTSTAKMINVLLASQDRKCGLYTSPHLHSYCERMQINGENIKEQEFARRLEEIKPAIKKVDAELDDPLTNFEIITALGFYYFATQQVDCVVLEVGMGARFDATCLTNAKVSVITNVELDHTEILGNTIEQIASEKSFVIKNGSKVVVGDLRPMAQEVIAARCLKENAELFALNKDFSLRSVEVMSDFTQCIDVNGLFTQYRHLNIPALGVHQATNACLAVAATELFTDRQVYLRKVKHPLSHISFDGRLEILQLRPMIIVDGAHNPAGARILAQTLKKQLEYEKLFLVIAIFKDKDYAAIMDELSPLAHETIVSENSHERSLKAEELEGLAQGNYQIIKPLDAAIKEATRLAGPKDLICVTGSLGTVADARIIIKQSKLIVNKN